MGQGLDADLHQRIPSRSCGLVLILVLILGQGPGGHVHLRAIGHRFADGEKNADQRQFQLVRVHVHAQSRRRLAGLTGLGRLRHLQRHALAQHHGQRALQAGQPAVQVHHQRMRAMVRPKTQQLLREAAGRVHRAQHGLGRQAQCRVLGAPLYQIGAVAQNAQLVVELMGKPACQPPHHLQTFALETGSGLFEAGSVHRSAF